MTTWGLLSLGCLLGWLARSYWGEGPVERPALSEAARRAAFIQDHNREFRS